MSKTKNNLIWILKWYKMNNIIILKTKIKPKLFLLCYDVFNNIIMKIIIKFLKKKQCFQLSFGSKYIITSALIFLDFVDEFIAFTIKTLNFNKILI